MPIPSRRSPSSIRRRLFVSYAVLSSLLVTVATGVPLALYAARMIQAARSEMIDRGTTLENVVAAVHDPTHPISPSMLARLVYADPRMRGRSRPLLIVDNIGRPIFALYAPPQRTGRQSTTLAVVGQPTAPAAPDADAGMAVGTTGQALLRRPTYPPGSRLPPLPRDRAGRPRIGDIQTADGVRLSYVTVPLPVNIDTTSVDPSWLAAPPEPPLHLAYVRPRAEMRDLWWPLVPSAALTGSFALVLAGLLAYVLARSITRPIEAVTRASERVAAGDYGARVATGGTDELDRLAAAFNRMAADVGDAHERQREFVVNVSHDLRTPLTTLRGFARSLADGTVRTEAQRARAVEAIESAGARMHEMVESLIDLARLDAQRGGMRQQAVPATHLLERVRAAHAAAAEEAGVTVTVDASDDAVLWVDPVWMERAVGNLLDNAVRHSVPRSTVELSVTRAGDTGAEIRVSDHGSGIPPEDLPRVFDRFFPGDRARATNGSGLGMAIAREIAEGHGGSIAVESAPGVGTRVTIGLPLPSGAAAVLARHDGDHAPVPGAVDRPEQRLDGETQAG